MTAAERTRLIVDSQSSGCSGWRARALRGASDGPPATTATATATATATTATTSPPPPPPPPQVLTITRSEFVKIRQVALRDKNDEDIIAAAASVAANDLHTKAVVQRMRGRAHLLLLPTPPPQRHLTPPPTASTRHLGDDRHLLPTDRAAVLIGIVGS